MVIDGGRKLRVLLVEVWIEFLDVNDNCFVFIEREYNGYILENIVFIVLIFIVVVVDLD